jgi:outer membrane protein insertion porin family
LFDRNIAVGADIFRRDFSSFNFLGDDRQTTYQEVSTGGQIRAGVPLTENLQLALRYGLTFSQLDLSQDLYFSDPDGIGPLQPTCDPLLAGRYLCDILGDRIVSTAGYTLLYSTLNNSIRPSAGHRVLLSQDFAGLGGDTRFIRTRASAAKYWSIGAGFIFSASIEGGAIVSFEDGDTGIDPVRLNDRFTLGSPQIRGFDIRGVGPRVIRRPYAVNADGTPILDAGAFTFVEDDNQQRDESVGGRYYYLARLEVEVPLGQSFRELGIRPSAFLDVGALFGVRQPNLLNIEPGSDLTRLQCQAADGTITVQAAGTTACPVDTSVFRFGISPFREFFFGDTPTPRVSIGIGANWNSPFGPFRIDLAYPLLKAEGDDTRIFTFNVGTAF